MSGLWFVAALSACGAAGSGLVACRGLVVAVCGCLCCADLVADTDLLFIICRWNERQKLPEQRQKLPERGSVLTGSVVVSAGLVQKVVKVSSLRKPPGITLGGGPDRVMFAAGGFFFCRIIRSW